MSLYLIALIYLFIMQLRT